jgi:CRP-like cAMP-binding protein
LWYAAAFAAYPSVMAGKIKTQAFLRNVPLFKQLADEEIDRIAAATTDLHVPRGEILFNRGDPCVGMHIVLYGQVKLAFVTPTGGEKVIEIIGPGQSFGEALMFMDKPYIVMAQTLADSLLLHVAKSAVFEGIERDPGFSRRMLAGLSQRLHSLVSDVESYSLLSAKQRVIGYLLRDDTAADSETATVMLPTAKSVVASRLNVTPEHFSRILHELTEAHLIEVRGREVRILDIAKLRAHTG